MKISATSLAALVVVVRAAVVNAQSSNGRGVSFVVLLSHFFIDRFRHWKIRYM